MQDSMTPATSAAFGQGGIRHVVVAAPVQRYLFDLFNWGIELNAPRIWRVRDCLYGYSDYDPFPRPTYALDSSG